jgi:phosphonate transport system substrate-binding protein
MKPKTRRRAGAALAAISLTLWLAGCGGTSSAGTSPDPKQGAAAESPTKIIFAAVPAEQQAELEKSYRTTVMVLEKALGVEVEFFQAADYAGVVEAMIAKKVDIAQFGPFSYVIAKGNGADIEPMAAMVDSAEASPGYYSYGIAKGDNTEITKLADFRGKKVCYADPGSTSGYLYPSAGLLGEKIDPEKDVTAVFAGGHDASALSVKNGDCDAGFAFDDMVDKRLIAKGDLAPGDLKVVWKSERIAGSPVAVGNHLPAELRTKITEVFEKQVNVPAAVQAGYCASEDDCSFSDEDNWGYKPVSDTDYDGVRKVCEVTKSAKCEGI